MIDPPSDSDRRLALRLESAPGASPRRERRIAARRAQILVAADAVFAAKGYHRATTREIAQAADVSEGTLYNYFASKRDIFTGLMVSRANTLTEAIVQVRADNIEGVMVQLLAGQFECMRAHRQFRLFLQEARLDPELNQTLVEDILPRISHEVKQLLETLMDAGVVRCVNPEIASWTMIGAVVGMGLFADLGAAPALETMSAEALAQQVADIFIHGLHGQT